MQKMSTKEKTLENNLNSNKTRHGSTPNANHTTNSSTSNRTNNWFRSIPRRIRKFISKQNHGSKKHLGLASSELTNSSGKFDTTTANNSNENADGNDESNLYSMVDYLGSDEEVAMIRACSQMAR